MSNVNAGSETKTSAEAGSQGEQKEKFVAAEAYEGVTKDLHKHKAKAKELEAKLAEFEANKEAERLAGLEAQKKFEELYKQTQEKLNATLAEKQTEREKFAEANKINALLQELGGVARKEYTKLLNPKAIELNEDGTINEDSLKKEAEKFRQEHFLLLKNSSAGKLPNGAPKDQPKTTLDFAKANLAEKTEMLKAEMAKLKR